MILKVVYVLIYLIDSSDFLNKILYIKIRCLNFVVPTLELETTMKTL